MRRLDWNFKGYFTFSEFVNEFLPIDEKYSQILLLRLPRQDGDLFSKETSDKLMSLWKVITEVEQIYETLKQNLLTSQVDFQLVFTEIAQNSGDYLRSQDLLTFIYKFDKKESLVKEVTESSIRCLVNKMLRGGKSQITYYEFMNEFMPRLSTKRKGRNINMNE